MTTEYRRVSVLALWVLMLAADSALAGDELEAAGDLDPTFGSGGIAIADFAHEDGRSMAIQSDGKIVIAGSAITGGLNDNFALTRFTASGGLDVAFGVGGLVETDLGSTSDWGRAVAIQSSGKIVVAGRTVNSSADFAVVRYTTHGNLDGTFGTGGFVTADPSGGGVDDAWAIAIQANDKIVVAGTANRATQDFAVVKYRSNGDPDTTFGTNGVVTTDLTGGHERCYAVAVQSLGQIVAVGAATNATTDFAVARYRTGGALDVTFGGTGFVTTDVGGFDDTAFGVALQDDGKIVVAGRACTDGSCSDSNFTVVRYLANGDLDSTFGSGGIVVTDIVGNDGEAYAVDVSPSGSIVVAGSTTIANKYAAGVICYTSLGQLDPRFGGSGVVITDFNNDNDYARAIAIQHDGKVVVGGYAYNLAHPGCDFAAARYFGVDVFFDGFESGDTTRWSATVP